jgi:hypothetical protein
MDLTLLANRELNVLKKIREVGWDIRFSDDPRYVQLWEEYREIHKEYAILSDFNLEALKRGVFIQWYAWSEPSQLSGIGLLDSHSMRRVLMALNRRISKGELDDEFKWMLCHYIKVMEIPFEMDADLTALQNLLPANKVAEMVYPAKIDREHMETRGGMGHYWNSMSMFS